MKSRALAPVQSEFPDLGRASGNLPPEDISALAQVDHSVAIQTSSDAAPELIPTTDFWQYTFLYFFALALAETVTELIDTRAGIICHSVIFALLVTQASIAIFRSESMGPSSQSDELRKQGNFLISMALVPLIRLSSLAMPVDIFPEWSWYGVIAFPLLVASWAATRACRYSLRDLGLAPWPNHRTLVITILTGISGIGLGRIEYAILKPAPLMATENPITLLAVALTLLVGTGFMEELVFRGILQVSAIDVFGVGWGIFLPSILFALLHIGHRSVLDVIFVFAIAIIFGCIVRSTRSLYGVIIAHGLTNICLFLVFPHFLA